MDTHNHICVPFAVAGRIITVAVIFYQKESKGKEKGKAEMEQHKERYGE